MTDDVVVPFTGITRLDGDASRVLEQASQIPFEGVVILGWRQDSEDIYFNSSIASGPEVLWLLEMTKRNLLEVGSGEAE